VTGWLWMAGAIVFEICGTTALKVSDGLTKLAPSVLVLLFYAGSFAMLALALKRVELGIAYAVWSGVGTAVIAAIGILVFRESASLLKLVSLALVVAGVVGLNLADSR
jgi:small multidrug resistance pump